jgi:hypothetical protein
MCMPERMPRHAWLFDPITCRCELTVVKDSSRSAVFPSVSQKPNRPAYRKLFREPEQHTRVRGCGTASGAPGGRLLAAARLPQPASDAAAVPRVRLLIAPVLAGSKLIRFVSMGPSAIHESGHFYFAQTGHSHFAATKLPLFVDLPFGAT